MFYVFRIKRVSKYVCLFSYIFLRLTTRDPSYVNFFDFTSGFCNQKRIKIDYKSRFMLSHNKAEMFQVQLSLS